MLFLPRLELVSSMNLTGRTSERERGPNVYLPPQRWQVTNIHISFFLLVLNVYATDRHCHFTAVRVRFETYSSHLSKVA